MEITIAVSKWDEALKEIEDYKKQFQEKVTGLVSEVTKIGEDQARAEFSTAQYDGTNDVEVKSKVRKRSATITAQGRSVLFIEFGTGIYHMMENYGYAQEYGFGPGTYGPKGLQRGWGYWGEPGTNGIQRKSGVVITRGNPANMCMYKAAREMERKAPKIAREVFK